MAKKKKILIQNPSLKKREEFIALIATKSDEIKAEQEAKQKNLEFKDVTYPRRDFAPVKLFLYGKKRKSRKLRM